MNHFTVPIAILVLRIVKKSPPITSERGGHTTTERRAVRRSIALGKAGRTMKKPTKVKMGIAQTLDKLQALHGMAVAIFRSKSRHNVC